jgi:hypothetical protein
LPHDVFDAYTWQRHGNDGPEAENLFAKGFHILALLFLQTLPPCISAWIHSLNVIEQLHLKCCTLMARKDGHTE